MTSETDNKVEAAVEFRWSCDDRDSQGGCRNPHGCHCAEITALLSSKEAADQRCDRLAREVAQWRGAAGDTQERLEAAEAKLSALVEALKQIKRYSRCNDSGNYPGIFRMAEQALASLDRTAPESAEPAQEVAGLVEVLAQIIQPIVRRWIYRTAHDGPDHLCSGIAQDAAAAVLSHCAALLSSPSQGGETVDRSGVAAADDNHKALVEIAREIDAEADNISPLNSVHPAGTMRNWATRIRDAAFQSRKEESR